MRRFPRTSPVSFIDEYDGSHPTIPSAQIGWIKPDRGYSIEIFDERSSMLNGLRHGEMKRLLRHVSRRMEYSCGFMASNTATHNRLVQHASRRVACLIVNQVRSLYRSYLR
mmetsp:Transcript_10139/g.31101  ORF Transcript_10139/g.31101 Transcript_10139/m.31101 type:complete len:111 (-) Transcript_10139:1471-1803(-)|eukprot:scaffold265282_cov36-Tisochrysis_lutea.AAC.1